MEPELVIEAVKARLLAIQFLDSTKHLAVHLLLLPLLPRSL
jgi:hypothetical protein